MAAGCGDGSDATSTATPVSSSTAATATATASSTENSADTSSAPTLAPPPARNPDEIAFVTVSDDVQYMPTVGEFADLPTVTVEGVEGVTLAALAARVGITDDRQVTVEGRSADFGAIRFWRGLLSESGESVVVAVDDQGLAYLAGEGIPEDARIHAIESIAFR